MFVLVIELWIPVRAAALRRQVQHKPKRVEVRRAARILSGIGHCSAHLAAIEVADDSVAPAEDTEAGDISVLGPYVGASVLAGPIGNERQIREAALILVIDQALNWRAGSYGDGNPADEG
jgi:hypothetical protein